MRSKNVLIISELQADHHTLTAALGRAVPERFTVTNANTLERPVEALIDKANDAVILAYAPETDYLLRLAAKNAIPTPILVLLDHPTPSLIEKIKGFGAMDYLIRGQIHDDLLHRIIDYSIELKSAKHKIALLSNQDTLTGALNRTGFRAHISRAVERSERNRVKAALLYIDIDGFTTINEQYGEAAGDHVVQVVSKRLAAKKRNTDSVARIGPDQFAVVLEDVQGDENVEMIARKMLSAVSEMITVGDQQITVTASIGASICPDHGTQYEDLFDCAEKAMVQAKSVPGSTVFVYADKLQMNPASQTSLAVDLRHALRRRQFVLHYQPQIELQNHTVAGLEALIRWDHPERGMIRPDEFLPLAEDMGLMQGIGYWVIEEAAQAANWLFSEGLEEIEIAVNISFNQFRDERFTEVVREIISKTGVDAKHLEFELTETSVLRNPKEAKQVMDELRELGIRFSLDDFGTGYSQLSHISDLPISALKIDKSFVSELPGNKGQAGICMALMAFARELDLTVVAEGAETLEQVQFLTTHLCHQVQGYFYSPALPLDSVPRFIQEQMVHTAT